MHHIYFAIVPIILAFAYRARGGAISLGDGRTTLARILFWGLPVGLTTTAIAYVYGLPLWLGLFGLIDLGGAWIGHSTEQADTAYAHEGMAIITTIMLFLILLPFYLYLGYIHQLRTHLTFISVLSMGPLGGIAYYLGYKMNRPLTLFGVKWCVSGDASWGEFFTGPAPFGLAFAILGITS